MSTANAQKQDVCPKCKTDAHLQSYHSVLFGLHDWPLALISFFTCMLAGMVLALDLTVSLCFSFLAIVPFLFVLLSKRICLNCLIEYRFEDHHEQGEPRK